MDGMNSRKLMAESAASSDGGESEINSEVKAYINDFEELQKMVAELDKKLTEKALLLEEKEKELSALAKKKKEIEASYEDYIIKTVSHIIGLETREQSMKEAFLKREGLIRTKLEELRQREERLKQLEEDLNKEKEKLAQLSKTIQTKGVAAGEDIQKLLDEKDKEIAELKKKLEEVSAGEIKVSAPSTEKEAKAIELLREKELEIKKLREMSKKKEKELAEFQKKLKEYEQMLMEREEELSKKEEELAAREEELLAGRGGGGDISDVDMKLQIEHEIKKRELMLKKKYEEEFKKKIEPYQKKIEALQKRNADLEAAADMLEEAELKLKALEKTLREREEELAYMEEKVKKKEARLIEERRRFEMEKNKIKNQIKNSEVEKIKLIIEQKNKELEELENKLREREEFLRRKEMAILNKQKKMIEEEIQAEEKIDAEAFGDKIATGIRRLDDLFYGGIPRKSAMLITGSRFTGEEQFLRLFVASGIQAGVPCIYVTTDMESTAIRDQMKVLIPRIEGFEQEGLLRYVDAFSAKNNLPMDDKATYYIKDRGNLTEVIEVLTKVFEDIKKQFNGPENIKLAVYTLTSFIVGNEDDISKIYDFLQALNSKCRAYNVTAMYTLQPGPLKKQTVETVKGQMLGIINLSKSIDKSYLKVEGLIEARSNNSIEYEVERRDVKIKGAFQTESIR